MSTQTSLNEEEYLYFLIEAEHFHYSNEENDVPYKFYINYLPQFEDAMLMLIFLEDMRKVNNIINIRLLSYLTHIRKLVFLNSVLLGLFYSLLIVSLSLQ